MTEAQEPDPGRLVRYPLSWPMWLAEKVTGAAKIRMMPVAVWLREAAVEKLEREEKER